LGRGYVLFLYKKPFIGFAYSVLSHCFGSNGLSHFVSLCDVAMPKCVVALKANAS